MELRTQRLRLIPLTLSQFQLLLNSTQAMEEALHLTFSHQCLDEHTQQAMYGLYQEACQNEENYLWYTNWQIILHSQNSAIGSACFMKSPNTEGEVEIGYGIYSAYQNNGYMTEAVTALLAWAFSQPNVTAVIAETEKDNIASHKVLQKCGLQQYEKSADSIWWRLQK